MSKLCLLPYCLQHEKKSLVIASWKIEPIAWYYAYNLCETQFPTFMLVSPIGSYWQEMKSCYSNFRHRCDLPICFFNLLILPPDWYSTHLASLPSKPQTSYVKFNVDMRLVKTCELKIQSPFFFLNLAAYASILEPLYFPHLPALLSSN